MSPRDVDGRGAAPDGGDGEPALARTRVLFVDDDDGYLRAVRRLLRPRSDIELLLARDGATARNIMQSEPPALVVVDVYMPDLDGIAFCRAIKSEPRTRATTVVVVSAAMTEGLEREARAAGAQHAFDKVADLERLFQVLREHDHAAEQRAGGASPPPPPDVPPRTRPAATVGQLGAGVAAEPAEPAALAALSPDMAAELAGREVVRGCAHWVDRDGVLRAARQALVVTRAARGAVSSELAHHVARVEALRVVLQAVQAASSDVRARALVPGQEADPPLGPAEYARDAIEDDEVAQLAALLERAPSLLPIKTALALTLRCGLGASLEDTALALGLSVARTHALWWRGRGLLRLAAAMN